MQMHDAISRKCCNNGKERKKESVESQTIKKYARNVREK